MSFQQRVPRRSEMLSAPGASEKVRALLEQARIGDDYDHFLQGMATAVKVASVAGTFGTNAAALAGGLPVGQTYQTADGDVLVVVGSSVPGSGVYDVNDYGAVGDGVANDRPAIQAAAAAAGPNGTVLFRAGLTYRISSGIILGYDDQTWIMYGATIAVDFVGAGITIGADAFRVFRCKVLGPTVQPASGVLDWTAGGCGIRLLSCSNCTVKDAFVRWLEKGIEITSPAPPNQRETTQNWIVNTLVSSCALPVYLYAEDGGTVNENQFIGGQIGYAGSDPSAVGRYAITIDHHAASFGNVNGVKFYGTYIGCSMTVNRPNAVYLDAVGTLFSGVHAENFPAPLVTLAGDALLGGVPNMFWGGAADWQYPEFDLASGGAGNTAAWVYNGLDGAGVAGGLRSSSAYVWLAKVLGASTKVAYAVKDSTDAITFTVTGGGGVRSFTPTGGIGYDTGAGGTVTQGSGSGKATGVTLNTVTGLITMDGAALASGAAVSFTLTNAAIAVTDSIIIQHNLVGTAGAYLLTAQAQTGSALITARNVTAGSLSEAIALRFTVIKGASA